MNATAEQPKEKVQNPTINPEKVIESLFLQLKAKPKNYSHTKAIPLFDNRWRINVYAYKQDNIPSLIKRVFIAGSFFVYVDRDGNITKLVSKETYEG